MNINLTTLTENPDFQSFQFQTGWEWADLYTMLDQQQESIVAETIIFDFSEVHKLPGGLIYHCPRVLKHLPGCVRRVIVVSRGNMMEHIHAITEQITQSSSNIELEFANSIKAILKSDL